MAWFTPNSRPLLIGSLPLTDHVKATRLVFEHTPETPLWVQLPAHPKEGMIDQFLPGFPGLKEEGEASLIDPTTDAFAQEMLTFYEKVLRITDSPEEMEIAPFAISTQRAKGFYTLFECLHELPCPPLALKGQITGPITFGTAVKDHQGRAIFYNDTLRDIMVKHLAMNARWQTQMLGRKAKPLLFFDEPALAAFGTSAYVTITEEDVISALNEMAEAVHAEGGLCGVHVCANTQWSLLFDADIDIVSFDAYSYFDRFCLFEKELKPFLEKGGRLAWGIVPTGSIADIEKESVESLFERWEKQMAALEAAGISRDRVKEASFVTPSCGTGSLPLAHAQKVLALTSDLSAKIRGV